MQKHIRLISLLFLVTLVELITTNYSYMKMCKC